MQCIYTQTITFTVWNNSIIKLSSSYQIMGTNEFICVLKVKRICFLPFDTVMQITNHCEHYTE